MHEPMARAQDDEPALAEALDRLYTAPLDRFVAVRRELVASLRAAGEAAAVQVVASATRPTRTAWALNQVAHRRPELLRALFDARDRATKAQKQGDAEKIRGSVQEYRDRLAAAVDGAREVATVSGFSFNAGQARRIAETLQATSAARSQAQASLLAGRLTRDVEVDDPFAGLESGSTRHGEKKHGQELRERARAMQQAAQDRVASLEQKAVEARAAARHAGALARRASSDAERANRDAEEAEKRLDEAREALERLKGDRT